MRNIFPFWLRSLLSVRKEKISKFKVLKTQAMKIMLYIKFSKKKKKKNTKIKVVEHIESENSNTGLFWWSSG